MPYQIALRFEDGVTRFIEANPTETVADAAYRQGINIPLDCRDGACGTCKCLRANRARSTMGDYIEDALTEDEAAARLRADLPDARQGQLRGAGAGVVGGVQDPQAAVEAAIQRGAPALGQHPVASR